MNRYELLKKESKIIFNFVQNGILNYLILRDIEIYEAYLSLDESITKELKYILLSEQFELSAERVKQILYVMEKSIKT